jgi:hypothetical protein
MAVANTLAYYVTATITAVKSFIVQAPKVTKKFYKIANTSNMKYLLYAFYSRKYAHVIII